MSPFAAALSGEEQGEAEKIEGTAVFADEIEPDRNDISIQTRILKLEESCRRKACVATLTARVSPTAPTAPSRIIVWASTD